MPLTETYGLVNGKAVAGETWLREPQSGQIRDVLDVVSGKMFGPLWPERIAAWEPCAICDAPVRRK